MTFLAKFENKLVHFVPQYLNCNSWTKDFDSFRCLLNSLNDSSFCIVGDLNARIGNCQNIDEHLIFNCPLISSSRKSKDPVLDSKGRKLLQVFDDIGGIVVNGRIVSNADGENTFCGVMGS